MSYQWGDSQEEKFKVMMAGGRSSVSSMAKALRLPPDEIRRRAITLGVPVPETIWRNPGPSFWTDPAHLAAFNAGSAQGLSSTAIAKLIGDGCTRNMVIGKRYRAADATPRPKGGRPAKQPAAPKKPRTYEARQQGRHMQLASVHRDILPPTPIVEAPPLSFARTSLAEMRRGQCHWPHGDPLTGDFGFCGGDAVGKKPYCAGHMQLAYMPPRAQTSAPRPLRR